MAMNQTEKRAKVSGILRDLEDDLSKNTLSDANRHAKLEELKVHGRNPTGADAIYCKQGISTLTRYAFGTYSSDVVLEASRVIANALLLQPKLQTTLIELDGLTQIAKLYQIQDDDFEFVGGRILFLCTFAANADFSQLPSQDFIDSIEHHIARHADALSRGKATSKPIETMAITETAKLIFSVQNKYPDEFKALDMVVPSLCRIVSLWQPVTPPLDTPIGPILNALACLDFGAVPAQSMDQEALDGQQDLVTKLVEILDRSTKSYKPLQLDVQALSLVTILRMLYDTSSGGCQQRMQQMLLPADSERDLPLGQSSSLASRLLRLTTSPGLTNLPEAISGLMFELSDKDATKFVNNIGYGYAAGYLMTHNIPIPDSIKNATSVESSSGKIPVNPITGQRLDKEKVPNVPEMTTEEKEREAEKLFVLFERLKATGVVDVENPVRKAMEEGRLEEISDSDG